MRFRSADVANRTKWKLTATLLDYLCAPYSLKLRNWHRLRLLLALKTGKLQLDDEDLDL